MEWGLTEISSFPLNITSLNLANSALIPLNGLRAFSQNITTLTSLNCSYKDSISTTDLLLISDCFPLLEELHLSKPAIFRGDFLSGMETLSLALPKLRKVNLSRHTYLNDQLLFQLFNNWKLLEEVIIFESTGITDAGIASALRVRPTLRSLSFHNFFKSDNISTLFALIKSCTSLSDIKMESPSDVTMKHTCMKEKNAENSNSLVDLAVCPQLKSLSLAHNTWLSDENIIIMFASIFPNLQLLDLSYCNQVSNSLTREKIVENTNSSMEFVVNHQLKSLFLTRNTWLSDENILMFASIFPNLQILDLSYCNQISDSICQVLRCCKLRHLNLAHCSKVKLRGLNFEVLKLEVLNLSYTGVDNEELYLISKSCRGLLQLLLEHCYYVTKRGVNHVVENCTQLREINLKNCYKVHKNIVDSMILSRPSLRKITVPPRYRFNNNKRELFLGHVCLLG
ncbi:putative leucine-rich repeat domain, L domain-containing protein [Medicago truncatula]|uniref:F-box/LRR protein n=1 Tax=Medicago truncatula TaxID=3880 RepID=G7JD59_MEDTR|nr:F-box/LRR-repeat protein 2 [Medicago truncatula]AES86373.2 F-box/LRR protein [Medicago truncatula]RHN58303.1 putative leucine-rich repeat domain, L domain-containing protein [Medicago truncatula]